MSKQGVHLRVLTVEVEEAVDEGEDLDGEGGADHVEGDGGQAVLLQEGHQETKTNEDHHVDVLEHWGRDFIIKYLWFINDLLLG